jgi:large subunit ribosomal protein L3
MKFILGRKLKMSQTYDNNGKWVPITLVEAGPCRVLQIKTKDKDGYEAVQIGFIEKKKRIKKSDKGKEFRFIREYRIKEESGNAKTGDQIGVNIFKEGDIVKVSGISKGKGFQGVVKKWGFRGRSTTHGTKHEVRTPGSVGMSFPERVLKGKRMAGRMGAERVTVRNLKIVKVDSENNLLAIKGAVPGRKGALLEIRTEK